MPKEYGTKLTLKDNFTAVIQKAISATEALKSKLESTEKALNKMGDKKVRIKAQLDSSVNSSLNKLADKIPKDKTIHIKAKDEVTRSVTNMKRDIFKMGNDIGMGMRDPFKGFSRSAMSATSNIGLMRSAAQDLARSMATSHVAAQMAGNSMAASAAAGVAASRIAGTKANGIRPTVFYKGSSHKDSSKGSVYPDPDYYESKEQYHRLGSGDVPDRFNRSSRSITSFDSDKADMIERQQKHMKKQFGVAYLKNYRATDEHIGGGDYLRTVDKKLSRPGYAYQRAKEWTGNKLGEAKMKLNLVTSEAEKKLNAFKSKISKSKGAEMLVRAKFAGERGMYGFKNMTATIGAKFKDMTATIGAKFKDMGASSGINSLWSKVNGLKGKTFSFSFKAITSGARAAIGSLKSAAVAAALAVGAITIGGGVKAVTGAASLESNIISMEHFVKYANTKKVSEGKESPKSKEQIKSETGSYVKKLRKYAVETPFGDTEVIDAGRRAVTVMNGDLKDAEGLVRIAGDMAALNPGKTIMEAMEALADMKTGDMGRLKEFGLDISAKEFNGLVGKGEGDDLTEEEKSQAYRTLMDHKFKTMFGGGAKEKSNSVEGKWSTLTGSISSGFADLGTMFGPGIKAGLDKAIAMVENALPRILKAFKPIADAFNKFMTGEGGGKSTWFANLGKMIQPAIDAFDNLFKKVDSGKALADYFAYLGAVFKVFSEVITSVAGVVGVVIADLVEFMCNHLGEAKQTYTNFSLIWANTWPWLSDILLTAWNTIKPALEALWYILLVICDVFTLAWPAISTVISTLWDIIKPIFKALGAVLEGIAWAAKKAHEALSGVLSAKAKLNGDTEISVETGSGSGYGGSERAVGMEYIPYNGYQISAHRGEAILTRTEADQWRAGKSGGAGGVVINIHDPVVREESDLHRLGTMLAQTLSDTRSNMGAVPA